MHYTWLIAIYMVLIQGVPCEPVVVHSPQTGQGYQMLSLDDRLKLGTQFIALTNNTRACAVQAVDPHIPDKIAELVTSNLKLIEYSFSFESYRSNPLLEGMTVAYTGNEWTLATIIEGKTILALAFDYGALSLLTLEFGVEQLDVVLKDEPVGCLGNLTEWEKIEVMTLSGMRQYAGPDKDVVVLPTQSLCHQVVQEKWGFALFTYQCCQPDSYGQVAECSIFDGNIWLTVVDVLLLSIRVIALFTVATEILALVLQTRPTYVPYVIKRDRPLKLTLKTLKAKQDERIRIEKQRINDQMCSVVSIPGQQAEVKCKLAIDVRKERGFQLYKQFLIKNSQPDPDVNGYGTAVKVLMDRIHIVVDYNRLQDENDIPVGFFQSIGQALFWCGLKDTDAFRDCCQANMFTLCTGLPLWKWIRIFKPFAMVLLVVLVPAVFSVRVVFYYMFECDEVAYRAGRAELVGLTMSPKKFNLMDYVKPTDPLFLVIYILYLCTFLLISYLAANGDKKKFSNIITTTLLDIQQTRSVELAKHFIETLTVPFTKCGVVGCIVFPIYLVCVIPIVFTMHIFYVLPLVYFTSRIISNACKFLRTPREDSPHLQKNCCIGSTESTLFNLLPNKYVKKMRGSPETISNMTDKYEKPVQASCLRHGLRILAVTLIIVTMFGLSLLAAECVGFLAELVTFTLMGIMVNAGVYLKFVSLALLILVYSSSCFRGVHKKYLKLNKSVFHSIKDMVWNEVISVTSQKAEYQENTAFKGENVCENIARATEANKHKTGALENRTVDDQHTEGTEMVEEVYTGSHENARLLPTNKCGSNQNEDHPISQSIIDDCVIPERHWKLSDVIFFVDKHDTPRIPRLLFQQVCKVDIDGSPGPVHLTMISSLKKFLTIILFLFFVLILISSFGAMYNISSTNQMLATLVGGLLPLLMRTFMTPADDSMELNSVSFQNKLNEILRDMEQKWPIHDLEILKVVTNIVEDMRVEDGNGKDNSEENGKGTDNNGDNGDCASGVNEVEKKNSARCEDDKAGGSAMTEQESELCKTNIDDDQVDVVIISTLGKIATRHRNTAQMV